MVTTTFVNGTLANANEVNQNFRESDNFITFLGSYPTFTDATGIVAHSASAFGLLSQTGTYYLTTDFITYTSKSTVLDSISLIARCKDAATKAFACEQTTTAETVYTSDSSTTVSAKTSMTWGTAVYALSFPTTNLIVVGGNDSPTDTKNIQYSTDQGTTWNKCVTSLGNPVSALDMYDGTTGFCVTSDKKIWKTTDGAANWTDTTFQVSQAVVNSGNLLCLTSNSFVYAGANHIELYTGAANSVTKCSCNGMCSIMKATSGDIYVVSIHNTNNPVEIFKSSDSGVSWSCWIINYTSTGTLSSAYNSLAYMLGNDMYGGGQLMNASFWKKTVG